MATSTSTPTSPALRPALKRGQSSDSRSRPQSPLSDGTTSPKPGQTGLGLPNVMSLTSSIGVPEQRYAPKVSFDTFADAHAVADSDSDAMFSFTLQAKSEGYRRSRTTRVFLCASSPDESGLEALEWSLESLVQQSDELVVLRGLDHEDVKARGPPGHEEIREEARKLMREIQVKNVEYDPDRKLSIVVEFVSGRLLETIERMIALYRPDALVVGTRGQSGVSTWASALTGGVGSVSRHCLSRSPVPVIVVRPERKVRKTVEKRRADPKRRTHFDDLTRTQTHLPKSPTTRPVGLPLTPNPTLP
ncbi:hypothetical protein BKA62DRAFT_685941 [Auriculariales sp. MPI-PUGE-AT-0066]|nr:hypothetical protein BKA62DRAFT_685941 [Auriculariales sp. MPI-PUGE-AT-0066]